MKLSAAFEASIALSFGDVLDAYQFFPSTLGISDNPDYRANLQHCRITDIDYKRNHAGVSDHVRSCARSYTREGCHHHALSGMPGEWLSGRKDTRHELGLTHLSASLERLGSTVPPQRPLVGRRPTAIVGWVSAGVQLHLDAAVELSGRAASRRG